MAMDKAIADVQKSIQVLSELYELRIKALRQVLKAYDDFSKANDDWIDGEDGAPKFVSDGRIVLQLTSD